MVAHTAWRSCDGLTVELEDGRRLYIDDAIAEVLPARSLGLGHLLVQLGAWVSRQLTAVRATPADRAVELPGNRAALAMAALCRSDAALGHFAGEPGTGPAAASVRAPGRIAA